MAANKGTAALAFLGALLLCSSAAALGVGDMDSALIDRANQHMRAGQPDRTIYADPAPPTHSQICSGLSSLVELVIRKHEDGTPRSVMTAAAAKSYDSEAARSLVLRLIVAVWNEPILGDDVLVQDRIYRAKKETYGACMTLR